MPAIRQYHCDTCEFSMPDGWGGHMYVQAKVCADCGEVVHESEDFCVGCGTRTEEVEAASFERIVCSHPTEHADVERVLGADAPEETVDARTGFNSNCVCLDCLSQFRLDTDRDQRRCPECTSERVVTEMELVGEACPNCESGTFIEGAMTAMA